MKIAMICALYCVLTTIGNAAETDLSVPVSRIVNNVKEEIKKLSSEMTFLVSTKDNGCIIIEYNVRVYKIYKRARGGAWASELTEVTGPDVSGWCISFTISDGEYHGALVRSKQPVLSIESARHEPYFFGSYSLETFKNSNAQINITFGEQADTKQLKKVYEAIVRAAKMELGESDAVDIDRLGRPGGK